MKKIDLTKGNITKTILLFTLPMVLGNLLQQMYNIADTLIVGRVLGSDALAAVGSAFALMTFFTSVLMGMCMGSGAMFSICWGEKNMDKLKMSIFTSFVMTSLFSVIINVMVFMFLDEILAFLNIPKEIYDMMKEYVTIIFFGVGFVFLYNFFSALLRSIGNSVIPLLFLAICAVLNIVLDLYFVICCDFGVKGAAWATLIAQAASAMGIGIYAWISQPLLRPKREHCYLQREILKEMAQFSLLTSLQQSVMNLGMIMVQGLVNSFGTVVMAAFAAAMKIDAFAYMPAQDFGNAFSTFIAQNYGAREKERIRIGIKKCVMMTCVFCIIVSLAVYVLAKPLMLIFVEAQETKILELGVEYLRIEGMFYCGIGCLFLLYGYYRAVGKPGMSVVLTVISLGTRVVLAYALSAVDIIGVKGIWWSVPIGWFFADMVGFCYYFRKMRNG